MCARQYFCSSALLPKDASLLSQINSAASRLHKKLISLLDLKSLGISEFNQRCLGDKLANPIGTLQCCTYLLALSLDGNNFPLQEFAFVDYGGGSGVLSLLAKELGIGRVIYSDIHDVQCNDAKIIARATGINVDHYVCGDIDELIAYVDNRSLSINAISSYDVIEHIYDIEAYLKKLHCLCRNQSLRVVFGSGANIKNPLIARRLRKAQLRSEYEDQEKTWGHHCERDSLRSCLSLRKEIIANYDPTLGREEIEEIGKNTRGLFKCDIEKCVDEYKATGRVSYRPKDPTNTCDPYTGNWSEHLMEPEWLESILKDGGFNVKILNGYYAYNSKDSLIKRHAKNVLNMLIQWSGRRGLTISNYYVLCADYIPGSDWRADAIEVES